MRRGWSGALVSGALVLGALGTTLWPPELSAVPRRIPVVDLHLDLSYQYNYKQLPFAQGSGQARAADLVRAGVLGVVLPLYIPREVSPQGPRLADLEQSYASVFGALLKTPPYRLPGCTEQRRSVMTWLSFEGAAPLADEPEQLPIWVARGVRLFGLVHSYDNRLAGSSGAPPGQQMGLTKLGRALVERIHALGGVVDVSHASDRATDEIIQLAAVAGRPVAASHSNARRVAPHPRNLTDAQIRGIAETGGVIGLNLHQRFLARHGSSASLADFVLQVQHLQRLVGIDHIALGTDFEGGIRPVPGVEDVSKLGQLQGALEAAGYGREELAHIFYKNALRILCPDDKLVQKAPSPEKSK